MSKYESVNILIKLTTREYQYLKEKSPAMVFGSVCIYMYVQIFTVSTFKRPFT